ncbi:meiotic recombination protein REC8 homolog [Montipora foliosa]|uniref:meiotic recombination protein REC8 homolog n=1 Tax=Montipora foliosa TaxID=591990 RepID=UPI0035F1CDE0
MFYSVDILTRKGRLGLIWLAATYGESRRGMTLREYKRVNISRACRDIIDPVVPFALRLSSNLMVGVVRIYREQTKNVWVEATHVYRTIKNAYGMRIRDIDLANPALREDAITDSLDFSTESFRFDLEIHAVGFMGPEGYFQVNGNGHSYPSLPPTGHFSPPSLPGTPVQLARPGLPQEWRGPSGSDIDLSPYQAREADIKMPERDHVRTRQDEPITIPGELDITGDLPLPDVAMPEHPAPGQQQQPPPDVQRRSPRPRSRSPRRRSRSPRARSRSPRRRSRSPRARSRSPRARSRSPRRRSPSPRQPISPPRPQSPRRPRDEQVAGPEIPSPSPPRPDPLVEEPSLADVLMIDEVTGQLKMPEVKDKDRVDISPTTIPEPELAVPIGYDTPGAPVVTVTPSPPRKRRKIRVDAMTQLSPNVIKRNVRTGGRETLCERRLDEHHLKSAKDLFMEPTTEVTRPEVLNYNHLLKVSVFQALCSSPFIEIWKANAVTIHGEFPSSDSGSSGKESSGPSRSPLGESVEVARSMDTPSEKEIARAAPLAEGSGLFERSDASSLGLTPDLPDVSVRPREPSSLSGDRGLRSEVDMDPTTARARSSSILRSSLTGLLSPIKEPSDLEDYMEEIGDLPTLLEQTEIRQSLEDQAFDIWRLVSKAFREIAEPFVFFNVWPPHSTSRKNAAKAFYHLLALHKNGVIQLEQKNPYMLTSIYIYKGVNY